jgi:hypothetical protein
MSFGEFAKLCTVWHLDRFWHIHVNSAEDGGFLAYMRKVSNQTTLPIRWSTLGGKVTWLLSGDITSPYEPAMYATMKGKIPSIHTVWMGFDPNSGLKLCIVNPKSGDYELEWNDDGGEDRPVTIISRNSQSQPWNELVAQMPDRAAIFDQTKLIYRTPIRVTCWSTPDYTRPRYYGKGNRKCSRIIDTDLLEQGWVSPEGVPSIVRSSGYQMHVWDDPTNPPPIEPITSMVGNQNLSRIDGPALVGLYYVKTLILGDVVRVQQMTTEYSNHWMINGQRMDPNKMAQIISQNGLIMREGPLHDYPAFPRPDDLLIWHAAWNH